MNKATIYTRSGKVMREFDCKEIQPQCGEVRRITTADGKSILTNLPVVVTGADVFPWDRQPDAEAKKRTFDVTLVLDGGTDLFTRTWEGAHSLSHYCGMTIFGHGDKKVAVNGPVLIENFAIENSAGKP